jgi:hypothetical protein
MLKPLNSIMAGALIAAAVTVLSIPTAKLAAGPLPVAASASMYACAERPWPYLNCVGTPFGNPRIRLVTTDHLTP